MLSSLLLLAAPPDAAMLHFLLDAVRADHGCERDAVDDARFKLDRERTLVLLHCAGGGVLPVVATARGERYLAALARFDREPASQRLFDPHWDAQSATLTISLDGSSVGFRWDGEGFRRTGALTPP